MKKHPGLFVLAMITALACLACFTIPNNDLYNKVIEEINRGTITPDASEQAKLPEPLAPASAGGNIYLKRIPGGFIVIFKTSIGKGSNFEGRMYTSVPLPASLIHKDGYDNERDAISFGSLDVVLEKKINENWYFANYMLD